MLELKTQSPEESPNVKTGFLLFEDNDTKRRFNDYEAGKQVARELKHKLCHDSQSKTWGEWTGTNWRMSNDPADAIHEIAKTVASGCEPIGYAQRYRNAITQQIEEHRHLERPTLATGVVPFKNGLLDIKTGYLKTATQDYATDYILPHKYDSKAECPTISAWLLEAVEGDEGTYLLLLAFLAALIRGLKIQKFLLLIGRGGTGKGTFQRLMVALTGESNTETSTLAAIENNRFEMAKHYGKRLCLINEAGKFGGQLNMLKAMTGGDHLPLERKHQQQSGTFVYGGLVVMATNDDIAASDSGLARRRITVRVDKVADDAQKQDWIDRGGESEVLHKEIPGLIRHLIELPEAEIYRRINNPPARVQAENILGMRAGSSVADWLLEECEFDLTAKTQIGKYKPDDPLAGNKLFPAYRLWCESTGRTHPLAQNKFKESLIETAATLGHELTESQCTDTRVIFIDGLKLRKTFSANMPSVPSNGFETEGTYQNYEGTEGTEGTFEKTTSQKIPYSTGGNDSANDYQLVKSGSTGGVL